LLEKIKDYIHVHATAGLSLHIHIYDKTKRNEEIIPAIKEHYGTIITNTTEKADILNSYYASVFVAMVTFRK